MTERTDAEWRALAESLPGWAYVDLALSEHTLYCAPLARDPRTRGVLTDFGERSGWLAAVRHRIGEPNSYTALYLLPDGRVGTTPMHRAPGAVHAIILAAQARHAADPARGWV